ncbi:MAG: ABC transporter ATP-binding protein [Microbacterium sp.]|nr:ABC transporter ATP-binding protein [Microbacterium sp.]
MPDGQVLDFSGLTKQFGSVLAVDGLTARVEPGAVTAFLGPNGAGKTTTLRILLGLVRPGSGSATIGGVPYAKLRQPLQTVGAVLEASSFHPGRSAANHLTVYAQAAGLPSSRVDEVLGTVGLADVAGRKVGGFSLGMRQRLGLAYALLGDPGVLVLDEPANGLDPEGIKWLRGLLRELARQGRTVLVSSHLLAEVQQTVDQLLIIARGRLVFQGALHELTDPTEYLTIVDAEDRDALVAQLQAADLPFEVLRSGVSVRGTDTATIGRLAAAAGIALTTLQRRGPALEEVFFELVNGVRAHPSATGSLGSGVPAPVGEPEAPTPGGAEGGTDAVAAATDETPEDEAAAPAEEAPAVPDESAHPDEDATAATLAAELAADAGATPAAASSAGAAFAVAATGVIDIVPRHEAAAESAPEAAPEAEGEAAAPFAEPAEGSRAIEDVQSEAPDVEVPSDAEAPAGAADGVDTDAHPAHDGSGDDHPGHDGHTDADAAADAFFAAFSGDDESASPGAPAPDESSPDEPGDGEQHPPEDAAPEGAHVHDDGDAHPDEHEGGEQR